MKPAKYGKPLINTMKPGMETSIQCGVFSSEMEWSFWEPSVTQSHQKMDKSASPRMFSTRLKDGKTAQIKDSKSTLVSKYIRQDTVWSLEQ